MRVIFTFLLALSLMFMLMSCGEKSEDKDHSSAYRIPEIAFITSGSLLENGSLPAGVLVASHFFNSNGVVMQNYDRSILADINQLEKFDIIILSSAAGYHDADREYSLTFMSDIELNNIQKWINKGGFLIAGDNIGRNKEDGVDRISLFGRLTPDNWPLSECFGITLSEMNMRGFCIQSDSVFTNPLRDTFQSDIWILVPDSFISKNTKVLAWWKSAGEKFPAFIENTYGNGKAYLISSSYFLHPSNMGGFWDIADIEKFYNFILEQYYKGKKQRIKVHPWPNAAPYAFSATINAYGALKQFERIYTLAKKFDVPLTAVVNGNTSEEVIRYLKRKKVDIASAGFQRFNYKGRSYSESLSDIICNEKHWELTFSGFRFPFTTSTAYGLMALNEQNYKWESSIGFNPETHSGSLFPYKLPLSFNGFFKTTEMFEVSPVFQDDYYYLGEVESKLAGNELVKAAALYKDYLMFTLDYYVKKYHGQFTYLGHPAYSAYNDTTLAVLESLFAKIQEEEAWITTPQKIADFRKNLEQIEVTVNEIADIINIELNCPDQIKLEYFSLELPQKPKSVEIETGNYQLVEKNKKYFLVFKALQGQSVKIKF